MRSGVKKIHGPLGIPFIERINCRATNFAPQSWYTQGEGRLPGTKPSLTIPIPGKILNDYDRSNRCTMLTQKKTTGEVIDCHTTVT